MSLPLSDVALGFCAAGFAVMGAVAILAPVRVTEQFDIPDLSAAGRNEVRAVYGGFGLAMFAILIAALLFAPLRTGICFTIGAALAGMAGGRLLSVALDRTINRLPAMYMTIEMIGAALLLYAA